MSSMGSASVWKMACMKGTYTSASCDRNEIATVIINIRFWVSPHPSPRFWIAEMRSRKTKQVNVYAKKRWGNEKKKKKISVSTSDGRECVSAGGGIGREWMRNEVARSRAL